MKEKPIIFSGPMVRAILEGRKTQTRRVIKPQPRAIGGKDLWEFNGGFFVGDDDMRSHLFHDWYGNDKCPYGGVYGDGSSDVLWVRETFTLTQFNEPVYRADARDKRGNRWNSIEPGDPDKEVIWKPSIHMPRWASRISLPLTAVRVERLQDISNNDALAEGTPDLRTIENNWELRDCFAHLWNSINGKKPGRTWEDNPWVWVLEWKEVIKNDISPT